MDKTELFIKVISLIQSGDTDCHCPVIPHGKCEIKYCEALLFDAIDNECDNIVQLLVRNHQVNVNIHRETEDHCTRSPFQLVLEKGNCKLVELFLKYEADVTAEWYARSSILEFCAMTNACLYGYTKIAELLLNHCEEFNLEEAICEAAVKGKKETVMLLINRGVSVNSESDGHTLLFNAVESKNEELVELLLNLGAEVNAKNEEEGSTPLHGAVDFTSKEIIQLLIDHGADIHATDDENNNILHYTEDAYCAKFFLDLGVDIEAVNIHGTTPLTYASYLYSSEATEIVRIFLDHGANINHGHDSPVEKALLHEKLETAKVLVMYTAQLKSDGKFVSESNLLAINGNNELKDFLNQCEKEIEAMKSWEIDNSSLTIYNLLQEKRDIVLEGLARNENITKILKSDDFTSNFPIFGSTIVGRFDKGILRNELFKQFNRFFHLLSTRQEVRLPKLPLTFVHQVFCHLSNEDLINCASFLQ